MADHHAADPRLSPRLVVQLLAQTGVEVQIRHYWKQQRKVILQSYNIKEAD